MTANGQAARVSSSQTLHEWEMVQRAQKFDQAALTWLYQLYYPKVYNYAFVHLSNVQLAEDVASDVMLKVLESLPGYRLRGVPFAAWVFRIARNRIIDLHRRRKRRGEVDLDAVTTAAEDDNPQGLAEQALDRNEIQAALVHLTEEQRQVIVLKFIEGFDNGSIARVMGRSEGAVKSLQHRALLSLRRLLTAGEA
ncbi:MAG: sigma-70 family RNA polymerase sigma factor [Chloroflexi bacterium]|nr:sigma-70 family RNA polymerase sigma factor [Chloroflexota bacterium]